MDMGKHEKKTFGICETYKSPSMKDIEGEMRGTTCIDIDFIISGPDQQPPKNFNAVLNSGNFKTALIHFLVKEWQRSRYLDHIQGHILIVGLHDKEYRYQVKEGGISMEG